jgi:hypothetical protein
LKEKSFLSLIFEGERVAGCPMGGTFPHRKFVQRSI